MDAKVLVMQDERNYPERLWDVDDLAAVLKKSRKGVYRLIEGPDGPPAIRIGKRAVRFAPAAIQAWLRDLEAG